MKKSELELKMEADKLKLAANTHIKINNMLDNINVADKDIAKLIIQKLANAKCTCSCGGHYKGNRNDQLVIDYKNQLLSNYSIATNFLSDQELYSIGSFNGIGSY